MRNKRIMEKIKIVLADDQILFVESLKIVLEMRAKDIKIVGIAMNGEEAFQCVQKEQPDIILMDVRMPLLDGVEATKLIHKKFPNIKIIMLTTFDDDEYVYEALVHGAAGYLLKNIPPPELINSIRSIKNGNVLFSPLVAKKLMKRLVSSQVLQNSSKEINPQNVSSGNIDVPVIKEKQNEQLVFLGGLNKREKDVLKLVVEGLDNRTIAEKLFLGEQTVKNYVSMLYSKTGTHDRVNLMKLIMEQNINL